MEIFGLGTTEILLIIIVILLFFGKDKLPELAHSVGRSFRELKSGFRDTDKPASSDSSKEKNKNAGRKSSK